MYAIDRHDRGGIHAGEVERRRNTINLGAGIYAEDDLVWNGAGKLTIVGAGAGATTIQRATTASSKITLNLEGSQPVDVIGRARASDRLGSQPGRGRGRRRRGSAQ